MNYRIIPQKMACNICNNIQEMNSDHCSACGVSFEFGKENAWETRPYIVDDSWKEKPYSTSAQEQKCLFENIEPGTITGLVCTCPKCSPR